MSQRPHRPTSSELIAAVLDDGAWTSWDEAPLAVAEPDSPYAVSLAFVIASASSSMAWIRTRMNARPRPALWF